MARSVWLYYRETRRETILLLGYYTNNGAKHAKMTVIRDYHGNREKGQRIKVQVMDFRFVVVKVLPEVLESYENGDPVQVEKEMRRKMKEKTDQVIARLMGVQTTF